MNSLLSKFNIDKTYFQLIKKKNYMENVMKYLKYYKNI